MTKQTIEKKLEELVYLYPTSQEPPKIPKSEYDAIYELFKQYCSLVYILYKSKEMFINQINS